MAARIDYEFPVRRTRPAGERRLYRLHRGAASSRVAAAALPTSWPLKVVQRRAAGKGDVERLLADTERRLEELERAGVDGFDGSLIPRVEWL